MLAAFINLIILIAILFFPAKALWSYIDKQNHIAQASTQAATEIKDNITQLTYQTTTQSPENLTPSQLKEEGLFFAAIDAAHEIKLLAEEQENNSLDRPENSPIAVQNEEFNNNEKAQTNNQISEPNLAKPENTPAPNNSIASQNNSAINQNTFAESQNNNNLQKPHNYNLAKPKKHKTISSSKNRPIELYIGPQKYEVQFSEKDNLVTYKAANPSSSDIPYYAGPQNYAGPQIQTNNNYSCPQTEGEIINLCEANGFPIHKGSISSAAGKAAKDIMVQINNYSPVPPPPPPQYMLNTHAIASISSPIPELSYDLVNLNTNGYDFRVFWRIRNNTTQPIYLDQRLRYLLSPTQLYLVDLHSQRRLQIRYDGQMPVANCLLADQIPPYGYIECSAEVGPPLYATNVGIISNKVLVYLPGSQKPIRVFTNL